MTLKTIVWIIAASLLYGLSRALEMAGDAAPFAKEGISNERLGYHLAALICFIGVIACVVFVARDLWRRSRG